MTFRIGTKVNHSYLGEGVVLKIDEDDKDILLVELKKRPPYSYNKGKRKIWSFSENFKRIKHGKVSKRS